MTRFIVIPAFNEEKSIAKVVTLSLKYVECVIVVDDCSTDTTRSQVIQAGGMCISLAKNVGYDHALERGLLEAIKLGATVILTIDADGQHPQNRIDLMCSLVERNESDIVIGIRKKLPRLSEKVFGIVFLCFFGISDMTCGMKCYKAETIKSMEFPPNYESIGTYILAKGIANGSKITKVKIDVVPRIGMSRFGINIKSEQKIARAMILSLLTAFRAS